MIYVAWGVASQETDTAQCEVLLQGHSPRFGMLENSGHTHMQVPHIKALEECPLGESEGLSPPAAQLN